MTRAPVLVLSRDVGTSQMLHGTRARALEAELTREVSSGHPLASRRCRAIAVGDDPDDIAFIVDHRELWLVHLTWHVESSSEWPFAVRLLSRPVVPFDGPAVRLTLDLVDAFDRDHVSVALAEIVRRDVIRTIMILRELKGLSLGDSKALLGMLESMGDARHEPGALSRTLSRLTSSAAGR